MNSEKRQQTLLALSSSISEDETNLLTMVKTASLELKKAQVQFLKIL